MFDHVRIEDLFSWVSEVQLRRLQFEFFMMIKPVRAHIVFHSFDSFIFWMRLCALAAHGTTIS